MTISPSNHRKSLCRKGTLLGLLIFLMLLVPSMTPKAQTQTNPDVQLSAVVGLDGYCVYDKWMPVRVTLENKIGDLDGQVEVKIGNGSNQLSQWHFSQPVVLPAVSRKEVTVFVYPSGNPSFITVAFTTAKGVVTQAVQNMNCLSGGSYLIGVWASSPSVYNILTTLNLGGGRGSVAELALADIPTHSEGLDMLNMLILSDVDTGALSEAQRQAIATWVENGGRLVVVGGPGWQKTSAGVADLLPIHLTGTATLADLGGFAWLSPDQEYPVGNTVVAIGTPQPDALALASQGDLSLILRQSVGFGDVFFWAVDPALTPLRNWAGLEQMYQYAFAAQLDIPTWAHGFNDWYTASTALSNIPGLGLPSIFLICGFLGLYIVALGPLNYLVLHKLKRRELAWVTIPVLVILFSCGAFVLGLGVRGTRSIVNHLAIVQVWSGQDQAQVHGLVGVFSPNRSQYTVQVKGNYLAHPLGDNTMSGAQDWQLTQHDHEISADNLRIDAGGVEGLAVEGEIPAPAFSSELLLQWNTSSTLVTGQVQNNSALTLEDAVILGPGQVQSVGTFGPGASTNVQMNILGSSFASPNGSFSAYSSPYGYDSTLQDVFGTSYISSSTDQDLARRYNLLEAAMGYSGTRGGGFYLVGWTNTSPLEVALNGKGFKAEHTSIYIIALDVNYENSASTLTFPPAMFKWDRLESSTNLDFSPYDAYLYQGFYHIRYKLSQPVPYGKVVSLTLHLTDYGMMGGHRLNISLWNFVTEAWTPISASDWGDYTVPDPAPFVGIDGEIRLQIENPLQESINIERADFTLVVEQ